MIMTYSQDKSRNAYVRRYSDERGPRTMLKSALFFASHMSTMIIQTRGRNPSGRLLWRTRITPKRDIFWSLFCCCWPKIYLDFCSTNFWGNSPSKKYVSSIAASWTTGLSAELSNVSPVMCVCDHMIAAARPVSWPEIFHHRMDGIFSLLSVLY